MKAQPEKEKPLTYVKYVAVNRKIAKQNNLNIIQHSNAFVMKHIKLFNTSFYYVTV